MAATWRFHGGISASPLLNAAPERQARSIGRLCSEFLVACPLEGPVRHHQSPQLFISDLHEVSESSSHDTKD
jgi:hypothetical protein